MAWTNGTSRTSTSEWKALKRKARHTLTYMCTQCGSEGPLELDHKVNKARGGTDTLDNVQWLCHDCHNIKTQKEAAERRGRFRRPNRPPLGGR